MGLKPDHWIRKMALEHGMIDPFVESQVREGVISYGLSSYGYDMRVSNQFKIFTNVHSAIVDPKNFTSDSFVDFEGDVCIIPPNSFVLASSVEYFRIPRSTLCITMGKSTYARCFRGDTRVALADGSSPTLEEMARRADDGEMFWGYGINQFGRIIITLLEAPRFIGRDSLIEITLDNDEPIYCTPDHEFIRRDGRLVQAADLRPNDALMPFDISLWRGYPMVYQPLNGMLYPAHRLADEWNLRHGIYEEMPNSHRHHIDHNRQNNNPWNIQRMDAAEHLRYHNEDFYYGEDFAPEEHSLSVKQAIQDLKKDPEWAAMFSESQRQKALDYWHKPEYAEQREAHIQKYFDSWTDERRAAKSRQMTEYFKDPANRQRVSEKSKEMWANASEERRNQQREIARQIRLRPEITEEAVRNALYETGTIRGAARLLNCDRAAFRRFEHVVDEFRASGAHTKGQRDITAEDIKMALHQTGSIRGAARLLDCNRSVFRRFPDVVAEFRSSPRYRNHKVKSIKPLTGDHDVYCLTAPETGNFALASGVMVKNCGLIVNVTPLEPQWEGIVTLEVSNTTPLPAKIYANEGIAQVLFYEADDEAEISYADKKGKYQGQRGVTPPRI